MYRICFLAFSTYCFAFRPRTRGVYVAVWCGGRLLLLRNSYRSRLYLPSGGIKSGELSLEAARRELMEEVGIDAAPRNLVLVYETRIDHDHMHDHVSTFELHLDREPVVEVDRREVTEAAFFSLEAAALLDVSPVVQDYVDRKLAQRRVASNA